MIFLNPLILAGLAAVALPVVIHLLSRRRATVIDWGAMRFLTASLAVRSRRVRIEQLALLTIRCMLVALAVLAAARPLLPSRPGASLVIIAATTPGAALLLAASAVAWKSRRLRLALLAGAAVLLAAGPAAGIVERRRQERMWDFAPGEKDVTVVIDGSLSMSLPAAGEAPRRTNFDLALDEARALVAACRRGDGVSVIFAGSVPTTVLAGPTTDRDAASKVLESLAAPGGSMRAAVSLSAAVRGLVAGANPHRKIILLTDGQRVGWDVRDDKTWRALGRSLGRSPMPVELIVRTLPAPRRIANAAVADVRFGRRLIGTDRPVAIDVCVRSAGTEPTGPARLSLLVDGRAVGARPLAGAPAGADEMVRLRHRFTSPGRHVVTVRLDLADDIPGDNEAVRVVDVRSSLGVLVVDGSASGGVLEGAADYIAPALSAVPRQAEEPAGQDGAAPSTRRGAPEPLMAVTTVAAPDAAKTIADGLDSCAAVVLADVPLLPKDAAAALAKYVADGGGLLIAAGPRCRADFYAAWRDRSGSLVAPARLVELRSSADSPARLLPGTFDHPALATAGNAAGDAGRALLTTWWRLAADANDPATGVGGLLDTHEPLLVERTLGRGRVLMLAGPLDTRGGNLPTLQCFVPLLREAVAYLAEPRLIEPNGRVGQDVIVALPGAAGRVKLGERLDLVAPSGARRRAAVISVAPEPQVRCAAPAEPGLHRLILPPDVAQRCAAMCPDANGIPIAVVDSADETSMAMLSDADLDAARRHVLAGLGRPAGEADRLLARVETTDELMAAWTGGVPGVELWRMMAAGLLLAMMVEAAAARWIAARRAAPAGPRWNSDARSKVDFERMRANPGAAPHTAGAREEQSLTG